MNLVVHGQTRRNARNAREDIGTWSQTWRGEETLEALQHALGRVGAGRGTAPSLLGSGYANALRASVPIGANLIERCSHIAHGFLHIPSSYASLRRRLRSWNSGAMTHSQPPSDRFHTVSAAEERRMLLDDDARYHQTRRYLHPLVQRAVAGFVPPGRQRDESVTSLLDQIPVAAQRYLAREGRADIRFSVYFTWYIHEYARRFHDGSRSAHGSGIQ